MSADTQDAETHQISKKNKKTENKKEQKKVFFFWFGVFCCFLWVWGFVLFFLVFGVWGFG
jgi:cell division septal protein FtsQ